MCRFFLYLGGRPPDQLLLDFVEISRRDRTIGWSHGSGWGVLFAKPGEYGLYKSTRPIWESYIAPPNGYILYILHSRLASVGSISLENTHPIVYGGYAIAHNGTLDKEEFAKALRQLGVETRTGGSTDTELVLKAFVDLGGDLKALKEVARLAAQYTVKDEPMMNFVITSLNGSTTYLVTYREVEEPHFTPVISIDNTSIAVASEPLKGRENWKIIPNGSIYIYSSSKNEITVDTF